MALDATGRFSPLYCRYNGFMLGQFLTVMCADYARHEYSFRRDRCNEFLTECEIEATVPVERIAFGTAEFNDMIRQVLLPVSERSHQTAQFALLGSYLVMYGHLVDQDPTTAHTLGGEIHRLVEQYDLPAVSLDDLSVTFRDDGSGRIDEALSPSLAYLAEVIEALTEEPGTCFVIMPFQQPFAGYFSSFYRATLEQLGLRAFRAWGGLSQENYCGLLIKLIAKSGLVWADVSDSNPNVLYEIGAAHALGKTSILVKSTQSESELPANIAHDAVFSYDPVNCTDQASTQTMATLVQALLMAAEMKG